MRPVSLVERRNSVNNPANAESILKNLIRGNLDRELKKTCKKRLNDFIEAFIADMDPDNDVEEQYKRKHDQTFCWHFLRTLSQINFTIIQKNNDPNKKNNNELFQGDFEHTARKIYMLEQNKPYLPDEKKTFYNQKSEDEEDEEDDQMVI